MKNSALPKEFEESLQGKLGIAYNLFLESLNRTPPISIRINPRKPFSLDGEVVPWSKYGKYLAKRPIFTLDPTFHGGTYYVQEASSMFLEQAITQSVDTTQPLRVLDLCAAPGGKSTHLLSLLHDESLLVTNEVIRSRAFVLSENIQKWGHANIVVTNNDPEDFSTLAGFFDLILVDAPCSGEGLFRKDPNAIKEWSPANVDLCSKRQQRILADVWPALKSNGILIYCTCTYNELENEENLRWLSNHYATEPIELKVDTSWGIETNKEKNLVGYRFYPHQAKGEGFFLSVIQKKETQNEIRIKSKTKLLAPERKIGEKLKEWVTNKNTYFYSWNDRVNAIPIDQLNEIEFLVQHLSIVKAGTPIATIKHDKLIPEHGSALSINLNKEIFQCINVNLEEALQYLRKESLTLNAQKGLALLLYKNVAIGWVNVLDNRVNNLYPKEWRIRMSD